MRAGIRRARLKHFPYFFRIEYLAGGVGAEAEFQTQLLQTRTGMLSKSTG
jgi:hypothetical protein